MLLAASSCRRSAGLDRGALRFEAKADFALALGRDAKVGDEFAVMFDHDTKTITKVTAFVKPPFHEDPVLLIFSRTA